MVNKSNLDIAFEVVSSRNEPVAFADIWAKITEEKGYTPEEAASHISRFYTNLSLDGRFVTLGENTWDLRSRHTFDKVHIDMNDVYSDVESDSEEDEDEEDIEYKKVLDPELDTEEDSTEKEDSDEKSNDSEEY